jgi:hypothetical protein
MSISENMERMMREVFSDYGSRGNVTHARGLPYNQVCAFFKWFSLFD